MPTAAVRSGSSAALSRMFQPAWRTAASATQPSAIGSTPRCYRPGRRRGAARGARRRGPGGASARCRASRSPSRPAAARRPRSATQAPIPTQSQLPTIGWPRCDGQRELVDPVRQLERRREQVDDERQDHDRRDDLGGERGADDAADREADPGQRERVQRRARRVPVTGVTTSNPASAAPIPIPSAITAVITHDREVDAEAARERPADARHRRRQQRLQPAAGLVGRPAVDEGRRREPGQDQPERDERQLEERAGAVELEVREQVCGRSPACRATGSRRRRVSDSDAAPKMKPIRPIPIPHDTASGSRSPERAAGRTAEADERGGDAAATGRATSGPGRGARTARRPRRTGRSRRSRPGRATPSRTGRPGAGGGPSSPTR